MISKISNNENAEEDNESEKPISKEILVVAQEIKIAKALAGNDPKQRDKQLKKLHRWLSIRSKSSFEFKDVDFLRIWKGLYYCMWMSDKPLVQENLAEDIAKTIDCFDDTRTAIRFFGAFLKTMSLEWFGIDQWRMDKFQLLVRRMFRYIFRAIHKHKWSDDCIEELNSQLMKSAFSANSIIGLSMHVADIFIEELAKVSQGDISPDAVANLLKPFILYMSQQKELKLLGFMRNRVFYHLLIQSSLGREYNEKFNAWKEMGFPSRSIYDIEKVEDLSDSEDEHLNETLDSTENHLDPRAGNVDVFIPEIPVDVAPIIKNLEEILYTDVTNTKSRKFLRTILEKYKIFETGVYPLGIKSIPKPNIEALEPLLEKKITDLEEFENELYSTTRKIKNLSKKKRRKLLSSINYEDLDVDNFEEAIAKALPERKRKITNDEWLEEEIEIPAKIKKTTSESKVTSAKVENKKKKLKKQELKKALSVKKVAEKENKTAKVKINSDKILNAKSSEDTIITQNENRPLFATSSEWDEPLKDGEIEYTVPSRKLKLKEANLKFSSSSASGDKSILVLNPFAKNKKKKEGTLSENSLLGKKGSKKNTSLQHQSTSSIRSAAKRVKIVLQKNMAQKPSDYIQQVRSSPQLPYDSKKKPSKSLLKPNLLPSPINPFYQKKIGLKLNDTF